MGFADGFYYGQGKIIVNADVLSAGDIIRVRSVTSPTKVWSKTVASGDAFVVLDVPGKDYYKVSMIQDVGGTETEVVSTYRTVDYGQTVYLEALLDTSTLRGIQAILDSHSETDILSLGDEVTVNISGTDTTFVIVGINIYESHEVILRRKYALPNAVGINGTSGVYYVNRTDARAALTAVYNGMTEQDKALVKDKDVNYEAPNTQLFTVADQKIWIPTRTEVYGDRSIEQPYNTQFPVFTSAQTRIMYIEGGTPVNWMLASATTNGWNNNYTDYVNTSGNITYTSGNTYLMPHFRLIADS